MELILSLLYVSSWFGAWVTRLVLKVPFSAWPFHDSKLDVIPSFVPNDYSIT